MVVQLEGNGCLQRMNVCITIVHLNPRVGQFKGLIRGAGKQQKLAQLQPRRHVVRGEFHDGSQIREDAWPIAAGLVDLGQGFPGSDKIPFEPDSIPQFNRRLWVVMH